MPSAARTAPRHRILLYDTHALLTAAWTRNCAPHPARIFLPPPPISLARVGLKTYAHVDLPVPVCFATPARRGTVHARRARVRSPPPGACVGSLLPHSHNGAPLGTLCSEYAHQRARTSRVFFLSLSQLRSTHTFLRPPTSCSSLRLRVRIAWIRPIDEWRARCYSLWLRWRAWRVFLCCVPVSRMRDWRHARLPACAFFLSLGTAASQPCSACFRPLTRRLLLKAALACLARLTYATRRYHARV
ncbi:hypothetical protein C8J57DRAFT_406653 [Mycena rebaudengoi]|nr:hypothetical protein C8J57DRAFT_406653 [Mycena rebaudengoi]